LQKWKTAAGITVLAAFAGSTAVSVWAQAPAATPAARPPVRRQGSAFPERAPIDPAVVDRGKALYGVHCNFCHGSDARGGEGGPNLLRSDLVLNDKNGELIGPVVRNGREGMPKFDLNPAQIADIAGFIHNFKVGGYDASRMVPPSIVVGNAASGEAYFKKTCAGCHSVNGDLKGIASRITDAKLLQQAWLMPGGGRGRASRVAPTTVTVTPASGPKAEGRLIRIDDFLVTLLDKDGDQKTFTRNGDTPKVAIHDPMQPHRELLGKYTDKDIHDLTAYLVTVK
jgi:cytochrome c oxidase cbb3-type subunit III